MPWELDELGMRIDFPRLKRDLTELGAIGRTAEGGVSRPSFSEAEMRALKYHVLTVDLAGRIASYVRIQLAERTQLHFHECEVYGY